MEDMQKYSMNTNVFTPREADLFNLFIILMCLYLYSAVCDHCLGAQHSTHFQNINTGKQELSRHC